MSKEPISLDSVFDKVPSPVLAQLIEGMTQKLHARDIQKQFEFAPAAPRPMNLDDLVTTLVTLLHTEEKPVTPEMVKVGLYEHKRIVFKKNHPRQYLPTTKAMNMKMFVDEDSCIPTETGLKVLLRTVLRPVKSMSIV